VCCAEKSHDSDVNCVAWHPSDPRLLASAGDDGCVRLWRLEGGAAAAAGWEFGGGGGSAAGGEVGAAADSREGA
jgi:hypothetical protein